MFPPPWGFLGAPGGLQETLENTREFSCRPPRTSRSPLKPLGSLLEPLRRLLEPLLEPLESPLEPLEASCSILQAPGGLAAPWTPGDSTGLAQTASRQLQTTQHSESLLETFQIRESEEVDSNGAITDIDK